MATTESIRVLHVDDDPEFLDLTVDMLEREDNRFTVETATSPAEARDRLADHEFDCIVSDYDMPIMDGIEFLSAVREEYPDLPFILFTGKGSEEVASDAISAGVTHYLQKRSGADQYTLLSNQIQNAVQQYRASNRAANLARIRTLINDINQALVRANSREEVETAVCEILADADPYETVWIGEVTTDQVIPRTAAGVASGDLAGVSLSTETAATRPINRAVSQQEIAVSEAEDYQRGSGPSTDGRRAMAAVPLVYEDTLFGVLVVYTDHAETFDQSERSVLVELADDIAHALHAVHIQSELERRNDLFKKAQDIADVGAWEYDIETEDLRWTAEVYEIHELPKDTAVTPEEAIEFYHPEDRGAIREAFHRAIDQGDSYDVELRLITADDDYRWVHTRGEPQFEDGELVRIRGTFQDITERKERERELELYRTMVETVPDAVYALNEDLHYIAVNSAMAELTGYSKEELVGSHLSLVVDEDPAETAKENRRKLLESEADVLTHEYAHRTAEGEEIPVENRFRLLPSDDGFRGTAGVIRDISHRKERERELEQQRDRYRSLFENNPLIIWEEDYSEAMEYLDALAAEVSDVETYLLENPDEMTQLMERIDIIDVNQNAISSYEAPSKEALINNMDQLFVEESTQVFAAQWAALADGETRFRAETVSRTLSGERREELLDMFVPENHSDDYSRVYVIGTDITEQKEREHELQRQNERLDKFTSVVSHDLRNPLNVASARLELAADECDSTHLQDVADAHERMERLIDDLLTFARAGTEALDHRTVRLPSLLEECWGSLHGEDATLVVETERAIVADRDRLQQLVKNLLTNAVDQGPTDVTVRVGSLEDGFYVEDDGPGIPSTDREDVFKAGYSRTDEGIGFGLSIVKEVAEAHGWDITVTDSADGGARFEITGIDIVE